MKIRRALNRGQACKTTNKEEMKFKKKKKSKRRAI